MAMPAHGFQTASRISSVDPLEILARGFPPFDLQRNVDDMSVATHNLQKRRLLTPTFWGSAALAYFFLPSRPSVQPAQGIERPTKVGA
ncbi:MAG: hypothetical protein HOM69_04125 [Gammaproteobacteria bacterium]|jgi:hypothetical protein|nr:hypothetical protein [Gammaproteobacteria bacterium]MBT5052393.1 hypothetical protein [Gammaproteobacteria bacterium]